MATFEFTSPDGKTYEVTGPDGATQEQAFAVLQQQIAAGTAQSTDSATNTAANIDSQLQAGLAAAQPDEADKTAQSIDSQLQSVQDKLQQEREAQPGSLSRIYGAQAKNYINSGGGMGMASDVQSQVNDNRQKRLSSFIPQARELVGTEKYKGMNETEIATDLMNVADAKAIGTTAATVATLPLGGSGGIALRFGMGALGAGASEAVGQAAAGATDAIQSGDSSQFGNNIDTGDIAKSAILGGGLSAGLPLVGRGLGIAGNSVRNGLSDIGVDLPALGISRDAANIRRYADSTNRDTVRNITQSGVNDAGDREAAQTVYNTATTDANGNSILLPDQVFNTNTRFGQRAVDAQNRNIANDGDFSTRLAQQQSGDSARRAVELSNYNPEVISPGNGSVLPAGTGRGEFAGTPTGVTGNATDDGESILQRAARNIGDDFRNTSNQLYTQSKDSAQQILDDANVKGLKLPNTKQIAQSHIDADDALGRGVNLTPDTRRTLTQFGKANFKNIDDVDKWKRTLNEKAAKAGRAGDYESQNALRQTSDSIKNETDSTLSSINPQAGSLYRDADAYYRESIGDVGSKSQLGKISANPNEQSVENSFFSPTTGEFNTRNIRDGVESTLGRVDGTPSQQAIADSAVDLGRGLGAAVRNRSLEAATKNGDFNAGVLSRTLARNAPQTQAADEIGTMGYLAQPAVDDTASMVSQSAMNNSLRNAADTLAAPRAASSSDSVVGGLTRSAVGTALGTVAGGPIGAAIGLVGGAAARRAISSGFVDALRGTNKKASQYVDWLSNPANASKVEEHLALKDYLKNNPGKRLSDKMAEEEATRLSALRASELQSPRGNYTQQDLDDYNAAVDRWADVTPEKMESMARKSVPFIQRMADASLDAANVLNQGMARSEAYNNQGNREADAIKQRAEDSRRAEIESRTLNRGNEVQPTPEAPVQQPQPTNDSNGAMISPRNEALYRGIVNAETGGLDDPWIRTKAKDKSSNLESSAYGPAQLTGSLVSDVLNRYPDIFTPEEKLYAQYFVQQAQVMNANPNDPTYGYGKKGVLGSTNKMKGLYNSMARKILNQLDQENGGDYDKVLQRWRGVNDPNYFNKVDQGVNAYINDYNNRNVG